MRDEKETEPRGRRDGNSRALVALLPAIFGSRNIVPEVGLVSLGIDAAALVKRSDSSGVSAIWIPRAMDFATVRCSPRGAWLLVRPNEAPQLSGPIEDYLELGGCRLRVHLDHDEPIVQR